MRVAHLACIAPPEIGGIGTVAFREVTGLRARGIDATLIAPTMLVPIDSTDERSFIERVKPYMRWGNASLLPLHHKKMMEADVIHLHYPFFGTAERILWKKPVTPVVLSFHMDAMEDGWKGAIFSLYRRIIQPLLLRNAVTVIVSSFDYARQSSLATFFTAHPERVYELPLSLDTDFFCPGPKRKERFSIPEHAKMVTFVGGLDQAHRFKGLPLLLQAIEKMDPSIHLVVISDGPLRPDYEQQARDLGIASRVHFMGRVDMSTLRDAYRSADVLAFPSTSQAEAFGLVALEASACGTPVVASALPGVRTVIRHGETGLLVPPNNLDALIASLSMILSDEELQKRLSTQARVWAVDRFSWERHMDELTGIYKKICVSPS